MRSNFPQTFFLICIILCWVVVSHAQDPPGKMYVLELSGNGYERGLQHGKQLKEKIAAIYTKWKEVLRKDTRRDPDSVIADFLGNAAFKATVKHHTPDLWDEVRGIADGSGQKFDDVLAFQLVDEYWAYLDKLAQNKRDKCSSIGKAATGDQPTFVAQNIDLEQFRQGYQVLIHIKSSKNFPEQYIVSCAGLIGFAGTNRNVGIVVNALMDLQTSTEGLPVAFIIRGTLAHEDPKKAMQFFRSIKHAAGQNYLIGLPDSVYDYEASANQLVRFLPVENTGLVYHTNHSLVNHDVKPWYEQYHQRVLAGQTKRGNSETRFAALEQRLNGPFENISVETFKSTLRSKDNERSPVCNTYNENGHGFTFSSVIFSVGKKAFVQVTNGSPDAAEYEQYYFR